MPSSELTASVVELVRRAKAGDQLAFAELVRRYRQRVYALALHITGHQAEADDVTQEVFLAVYRALGTFEERSQFFTWLYRVAVNRSLNARRNRRRRAETGLEDPRVTCAIAVDAAGNPGRALALRQIYSRLLAALDELSTEMRTTVVLVALQGLSHTEAAVVQGCSPGTIAWRIHVARRRLRQALEQSAASKQPAGEAGSVGSAASAEAECAVEDFEDLLSEWGWPLAIPR